MHYFSSIGSGVRELRWPQIPDFLYLAIMTLTTVSTTVLYCELWYCDKTSKVFFIEEHDHSTPNLFDFLAIGIGDIIPSWAMGLESLSIANFTYRWISTPFSWIFSPFPTPAPKMFTYLHAKKRRSWYYWVCTACTRGHVLQCMGTNWRSHHTLNHRHKIQFYSTTICLCEGALIQGWANFNLWP